MYSTKPECQFLLVLRLLSRRPPRTIRPLPPFCPHSLPPREKLPGSGKNQKNPDRRFRFGSPTAYISRANPPAPRSDSRGVLQTSSELEGDSLMAQTNWLRALKNRVSGTRPCSTIRKAKPRKSLRLEALEDRTLLANHILTVTTTVDEVSDNGQLSLREAIIQANAVPASESVEINLQLGRTYEIGADRGRFQIPQGDTESFLPFDANDPAYGDFDIRRPMTIHGWGSTIEAE